MPISDTGLALDASSWKEADKLFRSDPLWIGSDDAYSIPLSADRVLWLFGDTFIAPPGVSDRSASAFIRNSLGIQTGTDPSRGKIDFHWKTGADGSPESYFAAPEGVWYWPLHGLMLRDSLLLFMMQVRSTRSDLDDPIADWREEGPLGFFEVFDYAALHIANPGDDPSSWEVRELAHEGSQGVIYGAGVIELEGWVYAYGWLKRRGYLLRWPVEDAVEGSLMEPEHWTEVGWRRGGLSDRALVLSECATEFTVHKDPVTGSFIQTQMREILDPHIATRTATRPEGPWSDFDRVYTPPEASRPGVFIYAGKAHPHLTGADLVMTYASNGRDVEETLRDQSIYYPRFVRCTK